MQLSIEKLVDAMKWSRFPLSAQHDPVQIAEMSMGPNVLWLTEALAERVQLRPGHRVLDLGPPGRHHPQDSRTLRTLARRAAARTTCCLAAVPDSPVDRRVGFGPRHHL